MTENFLKNAKAYVGLIGAVITSLLGTVPPEGDLWRVLTYISAVLTAITIYSVPNKDVTGEHQDESVQPADLSISGEPGYAPNYQPDEDPVSGNQRDTPLWDPALNRTQRSEPYPGAYGQPYGGEHES